MTAFRIGERQLRKTFGIDLWPLHTEETSVCGAGASLVQGGKKAQETHEAQGIFADSQVI